MGIIERIGRTQFHIPFPISVLAGYYAARAAAAWAPVDHDEAKVRRLYKKFYRIARRHSGLAFDPGRVADLELGYNRAHRKLVGNPDKAEFMEVLTELHSALFGISREQARFSAEFRASANSTVDRITGGKSADLEADWAVLEDDLRRCYRSIASHLPDGKGHT